MIKYSDLFPQNPMELDRLERINHIIRIIKEKVWRVSFVHENNAYNIAIDQFTIRLNFIDDPDGEFNIAYSISDSNIKKILENLELTVKNIPNIYLIETKKDYGSLRICYSNKTLLNIELFEKFLNYPNTRVIIKVATYPYLYNNKLCNLQIMINGTNGKPGIIIPLCEKDMTVIRTLPEKIKDEYFSFIKTHIEILERKLKAYRELTNDFSNDELLLLELAENKPIYGGDT